LNIAGKLVGALIGLVAFHNPIGLLIGALFGHFYDTALSRLRPPSMGQGFIEPLFAFAGALSKSDGRVSEPEIAATEALMVRLRLDTAQRRSAIERFTIGKQTGFDASGAVAELRRWCAGRRDLAFIVLDLLLDLVYAEGQPADSKLALVRALCNALGVSEHELAALCAMKGYGAAGGRSDRTGAGAGTQGAWRQTPALDPYAVLGVERTAHERDIKRVYRKLMSQHHPDKLGDVPDELKRRAEDRAREINTAYERIKSERGIR
jgi:DnaJ like chaperone protein